MTYNELITRIRDRYYPERRRPLLERAFSDGWDGQGGDLARYVWAAMSEVDEEYTKLTMDAGREVRDYLSSKQSDVEYQFQGSVMTKTHIRYASDIDLLTITDKFYTSAINDVKTKLEQLPDNTYNHTVQKLKKYKEDFNEFKGSGIQVLADLRATEEQLLSGMRWYTCKTDNAKAIKLHNLFSNRDVDVVVAKWVDNIEYVLDPVKDNRGVAIFNKKHNNTEHTSRPFLAIQRINERSSETNGRLKRMIRFLKNVVYDSDPKIDLTSFEINALCFSIPVYVYKDLHYLQLVDVLCMQMAKYLVSVEAAQSLIAVDGTEYVFKKNPNRIEEMRKLLVILDALNKEIKTLPQRRML